MKPHMPNIIVTSLLLLAVHGCGGEDDVARPTKEPRQPRSSEAPAADFTEFTLTYTKGGGFSGAVLDVFSFGTAASGVWQDQYRQISLDQAKVIVALLADSEFFERTNLESDEPNVADYFYSTLHLEIGDDVYVEYVAQPDSDHKNRVDRIAEKIRDLINAPTPIDRIQD